MGKIEEKNSNKNRTDLEETIILDNLNEIVKKENKVKAKKIIEEQDALKKEIPKEKVVKEAEKVVKEAEKKEIKTLENKEEKVQQNNNVKPAEPEKVQSEYKPVETKIKPQKGKKALRIILLILFLVLFAVVFSTIFSLININNNNIMDGVKVNNHDISKLSKQNAIEMLNSKINNNENNYITVHRNGVTEIIHLEDINAKFNVEDAVNEAFKVGRNGNIVECNYQILLSKIFKKSINANMSYDKELLEKKIEEISLKMPDVALKSTYAISDNKLIIKNSTSGYSIKTDEFTKKMLEAFSSDKKSFEIPVEKIDKEEINIEKIYKEVRKEAQNSHYTTNPYKIYKEENGLDFAISLEEAKKILQDNKEEYEIPLKIIEPSIKVKDLDKGAFPDKLSTFTTYYGTGDSGRCHNIYLAAKSITETVVMPGEVFSYNDLIGECSTRTGYRVSTIYLNGELSTGIGGGICQGSTTLYNAVLRANLEIVERRNHSLNVTYVPLGHDAMVSIGSSDFKFKNNRDYPVKVVAYTGTGSITCEIYGLKNETEYEVKLDTKIIYNTAKAAKTVTYKVLYLDGKEVSRTVLSTDTYKKH